MRKATALGGFLLALLFFAGTAEACVSIPDAAGRIECFDPLNSGPRAGVTFVVTHDSWGPPGSGRNTARNQRGAAVGAEWWVLADGTIIHSDRERRTGHCGSNSAPAVGGNCNARAVGIEFEGFGNITQGQVRSGLALIRFLQERYCIQPTNIAGHRKAPREGIIMEQAGKNLNYRPNCTGVVSSSGLPEDVVSAANAAAQAYRPSLSEIYQSYSPNASAYQSPYYSSQPTYDSQGILSSFGVSSPEGLNTVFEYIPSQAPGDSLLEKLLEVAELPNHLEDEADEVTIEESKQFSPLKEGDVVYILDPNSSTTRAVEVQEVVGSTGIETRYVPRTGTSSSGTGASATFSDGENNRPEAVESRNGQVSESVSDSGGLERGLSLIERLRGNNDTALVSRREEGGKKPASALWLLIGFVTLALLWWVYVRWIR